MQVFTKSHQPIFRFLYLTIIFLILVCSSYWLSEIFIKASIKLTLSDFHTYYYIPKMVFEDKILPYENFTPLYPYYFPPTSIPFWMILTKMPFYLAKLLWSAVNIFLLVISLLLIAKIFKEGFVPILVFSAGLLLSSLSYPVRFTISDGQFNILILFIFSLLYYLSTQKNRANEITSGVLLAFGGVTKVSPLAVLIYFFRLRKFQTILFTALTVVVLVVLSEFVVARGINTYYFRHILKNVSRQAGGVGYTDQSANAFFKRSVVLKPIVLSTSHKLSLDEESVYSAINYVFVSILLAILFLRKKAVTGYSNLLEFLYLTIVGVVGTGLAWFHQYSILLFPTICVICLTVLARKKMLLILTLLSYVLINFDSPRYFLSGYPKLPWFLTTPTIFYGAVILLFVIYKLFQVDSFKPVFILFKKYPESIVPIGWRMVALIILCVSLFNLFYSNFPELLREGRDRARVEALKFTNKKLVALVTKTKEPFDRGVFTSEDKSSLLKNSWIPVKKEFRMVAADSLSTVYLDPINNHEYKYTFQSDGVDFVLTAKLESSKYISQYGEVFRLPSKANGL